MLIKLTARKILGTQTRLTAVLNLIRIQDFLQVTWQRGITQINTFNKAQNT